MGAFSVLYFSVLASVQCTQIILDEPQIVGHEAIFSFQSTSRGCYVIEERHPHLVELEHAPITVDYCKGLTAYGNLNHTDGRHLSWNYLATLVFYNSEPGRMRIPASAVQQASHVSGSHAFRLTPVQSCEGPESEVRQATLRITADFEHVLGREASFADNLSEILVTEAGLSQQQFSINGLRPGSIIVEMSLLPAGQSGRGSLSLLQDALSSDLSSKICELAGAESSSCSVTMTSSGAAAPKLHRRGGQSMEDDDLDRAGHDLILLVGIIAAFLCVCALVALVCGMRASSPCRTEQPSDKASVVVCTEPKDLEKNSEPMKATDPSDDASTASPQDSSAGGSSDDVNSQGTLEQLQAA